MALASTRMLCVRMLCVLVCLLCRLPGQLWYALRSSACVFFGHMRVAVCAGWGICGTGVDAHAVLFLRALQLWYAMLSMVAFLSAEGMVLWSGCYRSHATLKRDGS